MPEYQNGQICPWQFFEKQVKHLIIMPGITTVGDFRGCDHLETVYIPGTVEKNDIGLNGRNMNQKLEKKEIAGRLCSLIENSGSDVEKEMSLLKVHL